MRIEIKSERQSIGIFGSIISIGYSIQGLGNNLDSYTKKDVQKLIDALQVYHNNRKD